MAMGRGMKQLRVGGSGRARRGALADNVRTGGSSRCCQEDHACNIKALLPSKKRLLSKITDRIKITHKTRRKTAVIIRPFRKRH